MLIEVLKAKIHNATVTRKELNYEGSIGIDAAMLAASGIKVNQKVQVVNFNNGARFDTYVIAEEKGSGLISLYGPAARQAESGDMVCIIAYGLLDEDQAPAVRPRVVLLGAGNKIKG